jgi:uncharacterized protein
VKRPCKIQYYDPTVINGGTVESNRNRCAVSALPARYNGIPLSAANWSKFLTNDDSFLHAGGYHTDGYGYRVPMKFDGNFEITDVTVEEVWLALSDPHMIKECLPGCRFLVEVEVDNPNFDELEEQHASDTDPELLPEADPETVAERAFVEGGSYAALIELSVGAVKPRFETVATIEEREMPQMTASAEGSSGNSSFEMTAGMELSETENGVLVEWWAETDVFGRIAQMGQRVIKPVADRVVNKFFSRVEDELSEVAEEEDSSGVRNRIRSLMGDT